MGGGGGYLPGVGGGIGNNLWIGGGSYIFRHTVGSEFSFHKNKMSQLRGGFAPAPIPPLPPTPASPYPYISGSSVTFVKR